MFLEGAGYVYYIETDSKTVLISTNLKGANGDLFNSENKGMVAVDENLLSFAKELFKKANEEKAALANLASGENPPTGAAVPAYFADNSEYNNTSSCILPDRRLRRRRSRRLRFRRSRRLRLQPRCLSRGRAGRVRESWRCSLQSAGRRYCR